MLPPASILPEAIPTNPETYGEDVEAIEVIEVVEVVDYPPVYRQAAVVIQAIWRGFSARRRYEEEKVTRHWVVVRLQSLFWGRRARRAYATRLR